VPVLLLRGCFRPARPGTEAGRKERIGWEERCRRNWRTLLAHGAERWATRLSRSEMSRRRVESKQLFARWRTYMATGTKGTERAVRAPSTARIAPAECSVVRGSRPALFLLGDEVRQRHGLAELLHDHPRRVGTTVDRNCSWSATNSHCVRCGGHHRASVCRRTDPRLPPGCAYLQQPAFRAALSSESRQGLTTRWKNKAADPPRLCRFRPPLLQVGDQRAPAHFHMR